MMKLLQRILKKLFHCKEPEPVWTCPHGNGPDSDQCPVCCH